MYPGQIQQPGKTHLAFSHDFNWTVEGADWQLHKPHDKKKICKTKHSAIPGCGHKVHRALKKLKLKTYMCMCMCCVCVSAYLFVHMFIIEFS